MTDSSEVDPLLFDFLVESREGLDRLDGDFVVLEQHPDDRDTLASVFRTVHTIKGTCGFLGLAELERLTHVGENLLVKLRDGELSLTADMTSTLLELVDAVRLLLAQIERDGHDAGDHDRLIAALEAHARGEAGASDAAGDELVDAGKSREQSPSDSCDVVATAGEHAPAALTAEPRRVEHDEETAAVIADFLAESDEGLERVSTELIELEANPDDRSIVSSIFRTIHTIKGTCGFFEFGRLERLTHAGENLLVALREGELAMDGRIADALLEMVDSVKLMLDGIRHYGHDDVLDAEALTLRLLALAAAEPVPDAVPAKPAPIGSAADATALAGQPIGEAPPLAVADTVAAVGDEDAAAAAPSATPAPEPRRDASGSTDARTATASNGGAHVPAGESSIRVDVPLLDALMNQVGELVLARNQILAFSNRQDDPAFTAAAQRLNLITSELQDGVMQTRMQPINSIWAKLPRVVRDLSRGVGKQVRVEMEGKETELDKSLIEAMKDPLTHLVRNSVDHGIEVPERRRAAGKPAEGLLFLKAWHEGGQVHIEIRDDGAGIDPDKLVAKAVRMGLVTAVQAESMTHVDRCKLIFHAGLSTAEQVTNISGRGVGMDVVKTNIDAISGSIDLDSEPGVGTTFRIRVPLTLAIVPALIVTSGGERFAIPQANLLELIRVDGARRDTVIENVNGAPVMRLRGRLLPIVHLNEQLRLEDTDDETLNVVVLHTAETRFGLVVDRIDESQEIVVKPLAEALRSVAVYAGATIMGDGCLALIVDAGGLAAHAGLLEPGARERLARVVDEDADTSTDRRALLLVRASSGSRVAIPLSEVARLEQFENSMREQAGSRSVVQYRGQILPLVSLADVLQEFDALPQSDVSTTRVVVFGADGRQVGLVVDEILDVVEEALSITGDSGRSGVLQTAVVQQRVTELLDVQSFLDAYTPRMAHAAGA